MNLRWGGGGFTCWDNLRCRSRRSQTKTTSCSRHVVDNNKFCGANKKEEKMHNLRIKSRITSYIEKPGSDTLAHKEPKDGLKTHLLQ